MLFGKLEHVGPIVKGWAFDSESSRGCTIDVYVDGRKSFSFVSGNDHRQDVSDFINLQYGFDGTDCGFLIDLTGALGHRPAAVELRYNRSNAKIDGVNPFQAHALKSKHLVFDGLDDYKFFGGSHSIVINRLNGSISSEHKTNMGWAALYGLYEAITKKNGGTFVPVVVPEKVSVIPHLVSEDFELADERAITHVKSISSRIYAIDVMYPLDLLCDDEGVDQITTRTDSHLSYRAHHRIFETVLERLDLAPIAPSVEWVATPFAHDLALCEGTTVAESEDLPRLPDQDDIVALHSRGANCTIYVNKRGSVPLVVLCGHSSCAMFSTYVRQIARVTVVFLGDNVDVGLLSSIKPDLFIHYMTERKLYNVPNPIRDASMIDTRMIGRALELSRRISVRADEVPAAAAEPHFEPEIGARMIDSSEEARSIAASEAEAIQSDDGRGERDADESGVPQAAPRPPRSTRISSP